MSVIQVTGSGKSTAADRTPIYGSKVPAEVKAMIKPLSKLDKTVFKKLLIILVSACEGKCVEYKQFKELATSELTEETISVIYAGLLKLVKCALRLPFASLKQENFKEDLQELQIPSDFHTDLASVVFGSRRSHIDAVSLNSRPRLPQIDDLKWRVDVGISTSVLNRVLEPTVLMEMTLTDGKIHTFEQTVKTQMKELLQEHITTYDVLVNSKDPDERALRRALSSESFLFVIDIAVPVSKFHELRYNVAFVLKEMEDLEKRSILKIQD